MVNISVGVDFYNSYFIVHDLVALGTAPGHPTPCPARSLRSQAAVSGAHTPMQLVLIIKDWFRLLQLTSWEAITSVQRLQSEPINVKMNAIID